MSLKNSYLLNQFSLLHATGINTYNVIIRDLVDLAPSVHDPSIVRRNDCHDIDALALQLVELLDEGREMHGLTSWRECTCDV